MQTLPINHRVLFKQNLKKSVLTKPLKRLTDQRRTKQVSKLGKCKVCGDEAKVINYGALSCQPCKTFFRRNGLHPERVSPCVNGGLCIITKETRRNCSSCRLLKCTSEGMSSDLIRKEEKKSTRNSSRLKDQDNIHTVHQLTKSSTQLWMFDRLDCEGCFLLDHEKKILSNVVHALEIHNAIPKVRGVIEDELILFFHFPFDQSEASQCIDYIYTSLQSFINCTPDFQILVLDEQCSLLQRNFIGVVNLYSALVFRHTGIINRPDLIESFASIYGSEMMFELVSISRQLEDDLISIKLFLLVLAFSPNCSMVDYQPKTCHDILLTGTHRLFSSQNVYVIVLWKYMVCRYGNFNAVCYFSRLIQFSLNLIQSSTKAYMNNEIFHRLVDEFNESIKQVLLVTSEKVVVRLWGII